MQQAHDFLDESETLAAALSELPDEGWQRRTQFKGWTINDVIVHLHFWNRAADLSLHDPARFQTFISDVVARLPEDGFRRVENDHVAERGRALFDAWTAFFRDMGPRWSKVDPKARVQWAGPEMSTRSSITARQMETWAHGQEIFDLLGLVRQDTDRIRNIVVLGVNTFAWSHKVQHLDIPDTVPALELVAPSGAVWHFGDPDSPDSIQGAAVEFAQVVTQTRNIADTALDVNGPIATQWMATAQCFAGGKETPPPPGARYTAP